MEQHRADGLDRIGSVKWSLALCLLAVFLLVYFSLWKGVRSTGMVHYILYRGRSLKTIFSSVPAKWRAQFFQRRKGRHARLFRIKKENYEKF